MNKNRNRSKITGRRESGTFLALPTNILKSPQYAALSAQAVKLLVDIGAQYRGSNNGDLCATWKVMHGLGWKSRNTLGYAKSELLRAGFIEITRGGGLRFPTLYALTWRSVDECGGKLQVASSHVASNLWKESRVEASIQNADTPGVSIRHAGSVNMEAA